MANITPDEEREIREWQKRTGGGCIDRRETTEERIARLEREVARNLMQLIQLKRRLKK